MILQELKWIDVQPSEGLPILKESKHGFFTIYEKPEGTATIFVNIGKDPYFGGVHVSSVYDAKSLARQIFKNILQSYLT